MTYKELLEKLQNLNKEQLEQTVTVYLGDDEFMGIDMLTIDDTLADGVLDEGHLFLVWKVGLSYDRTYNDSIKQSNWVTRN